MNVIKQDLFNDYTSTIAEHFGSINSSCLTIIGDFNADISMKWEYLP